MWLLTATCLSLCCHLDQSNTYTASTCYPEHHPKPHLPCAEQFGPCGGCCWFSPHEVQSGSAERVSVLDKTGFPSTQLFVCVWVKHELLSNSYLQLQSSERSCKCLFSCLTSFSPPQTSQYLILFLWHFFSISLIEYSLTNNNSCNAPVLEAEGWLDDYRMENVMVNVLLVHKMRGT